jgi:GTPase SAR1 family protein
MNNTKTYSLVVTGMSNVGKTTICGYLTNPVIKTQQTTIGIMFASYETRGYKLNIWDTSTLYIYSISKVFYDKSQSIIAVFRVSDIHSFKVALDILSKTKRDHPEKLRYLVANKFCNCEQVVSDNEITIEANKIDTNVFRLSVEEDDGCIHKMFHDVLTDLIKHKEPQLSKNNIDENNNCCYQCIKKMICYKNK